MQINHFETENSILVTLAPLSTQIHSIILRDRCLFQGKQEYFPDFPRCKNNPEISPAHVL